MGPSRGITHDMAPQSRAFPVLLTRPAAQGDRFAADLAAMGAFDIVQSPLIAPQFFAPDWPDMPWAGVIFTSETGVVAAGRLVAAGRRLPARAWCVGARTADAARRAGFDAVSADGDAADLVALVAAQGQGPLLHLRGQDSRGDVANTLTDQGITTLSAIVYQMQEQPLSPAAVALLAGEDPVILPLFSPRTATIFAHQARANAPLWVAAISETVAQVAKTLAPARLITAQSPQALAMLQAIKEVMSLPAP